MMAFHLHGDGDVKRGPRHRLTRCECDGRGIEGASSMGVSNLSPNTSHN